jgi:hypothetical protein
MFDPGVYPKLPWRWRLLTLGVAAFVSLNVLVLWVWGERLAKLMEAIEHQEVIADAVAKHRAEHPYTPGIVGVEIVPPKQPASAP